jgi:hypothetical protein
MDAATPSPYFLHAIHGAWVSSGFMAGGLKPRSRKTDAGTAILAVVWPRVWPIKLPVVSQVRTPSPRKNAHLIEGIGLRRALIQQLRFDRALLLFAGGVRPGYKSRYAECNLRNVQVFAVRTNRTCVSPLRDLRS